MNTKHLRGQTIHSNVTDREALVTALENYRRTWQEATPDTSLVDATAPVGLVIADITASLGLDRQERFRVLGPDLDAAVVAYLEEPIQLKL